ncbi:MULTISPECIES: long-chain fatty acid--CoA ligase [Clostridia]|uniref:class I adenylate-forming enzyme family protein n=1 Tax=Clostridia TaxID=186801 RepID=UPI00141252C9|nr:MULTISPECIES: long-chain fatty acid--CoA ligase [Clostridia]
MNLGMTLARNARQIPEKKAVIFGDISYTYKQLNEKVNQLANGLIAHRIKKGEKIAILMKNSDQFMIVFYAIMKVGAIAVPINFRLTAVEVRYIVEDSDAAVIFFDRSYATLVSQVVENNKNIKLQVCVGNKTEKNQITMNAIRNDNVSEPVVEVLESDDAEILYTSGTTGNPKGAVFDHHRILYVAFTSAIMMKMGPEDNLLHVAPLFHSAQLNLFMITGTLLGSMHVIQQDFQPDLVLQAIEHYEISLFFAVPTMYNFLLQVPNYEKYDLTSVKRCGYGSAPMPTALIQKAMTLFGHKQFFNMCGLTEAGPGGVLLLPDEHKTKMGAGGKAMLCTEVRVVNERGEDVAPFETGEFIIKSEMVMKEYYKNPEETRQALRDGWLYTGDLATMDEDGYVTLVDRKKDMIISGGENIYSTEVEQVLYQYPDILEAAVIGLPDEVWGEKVVAIVVGKKGENLDEEALKLFCSERLASYKVPTEIIVKDTIPRNASGKILKYRLREALS